jgi:hypothetical protein
MVTYIRSKPKWNYTLVFDFLLVKQVLKHLLLLPRILRLKNENG